MKNLCLSKLLKGSLILMIAAAFLAACSSSPGPTLTKRVDAVSVSPASATVSVDDVLTLKATVSGVNLVSTEQGVSWTSDHAEIASVSAEGVMSAKSAGNTTITATSSFDASKAASVSITVTAPTSDIPYYGEWAWAVYFSADDEPFVGTLSISEAFFSDYDPTGYFEQGGQGAWTWCADDPCGPADGIGVIADYVEHGLRELMTGFVDTSSGEVRLIALDGDNQLGTELEGKPTFLGAGLWWFSADDDYAQVGIAMVKLADMPVITSASGFNVQAFGEVDEALIHSALSSQATNELLAQGALDVLDNYLMERGER